MKKKRYTLRDRLPFGKYKGISIREILAKDASYIEWCKKNVKGFSLVTEKMVPDADFYTDGIEILKTNPWTSRFMASAQRFAEDVNFVILEPLGGLHASHQQLELQFVY